MADSSWASSAGPWIARKRLRYLAVGISAALFGIVFMGIAHLIYELVAQGSFYVGNPSWLCHVSTFNGPRATVGSPVAGGWRSITTFKTHSVWTQCSLKKNWLILIVSGIVGCAVGACLAVLVGRRLQSGKREAKNFEPDSDLVGPRVC